MFLAICHKAEPWSLSLPPTLSSPAPGSTPPVPHRRRSRSSPLFSSLVSPATIRNDGHFFQVQNLWDFLSLRSPGQKFQPPYSLGLNRAPTTFPGTEPLKQLSKWQYIRIKNLAPSNSWNCKKKLTTCQLTPFSHSQEKNTFKNFQRFFKSALPFQNLWFPPNPWPWSLVVRHLPRWPQWAEISPWKDLRKHQVAQPFPVALLCIGTDPAQFRTKKWPQPWEGQLKLTF